MKSDKEQKNQAGRGRRSHLADFHLNEEGKYQYEGEMIVMQPTGAARTQLIARLYLALGGTVALAIAGGFLPQTGINGHPLCVVPYAGSFLCLFLTAYAFVRLARAGEKVRGYLWKKTARRLPGYSIAGAVCCFLTSAVLCIVMLTGRFKGLFPAGLCFLFFTAAEGGLFVLFFLMAKGISGTPEDASVH